jgi:hypothetical protein
MAHQILTIFGVDFDHFITALLTPHFGQFITPILSIDFDIIFGQFLTPNFQYFLINF